MQVIFLSYFHMQKFQQFCSSYVVNIWSFVCKVFFFIFVLGLFLYEVYEVVLLSFDRLFVSNFFCLFKESKKIISYAPLFYSFQNPIVHWVALPSVKLDLITLPSHTSQALQPLDVACFKPFKTAFKVHRDVWTLINKGVGKEDLA